MFKRGNAASLSIYIYTENGSMKIYKYEQTQGLQMIIFLVESSSQC